MYGILFNTDGFAIGPFLDSPAEIGLLQDIEMEDVRIEKVKGAPVHTIGLRNYNEAGEFDGLK